MPPDTLHNVFCDMVRTDAYHVLLLFLLIDLDTHKGSYDPNARDLYQYTLQGIMKEAAHSNNLQKMARECALSMTS
jgi:hypothetical protein